MIKYLLTNDKLFRCKDKAFSHSHQTKTEEYYRFSINFYRKTLKQRKSYLWHKY